MRRQIAALGVAAALVFASTTALSESVSVASQGSRFHQLTDVKGTKPVGQLLALRGNDVITATVVIAGDSVAQQVATARDAGGDLSESQRSNSRQQVAASQSAISAAVSASGVEVLYTLQDAVNALVVKGTRTQIATLSSIAGVSSVQPSRKVVRDNANSNTFTGVTSAWESLGVTGVGQKIAVIDTGIDYTHADFGGSGVVADYTGNNRAVIEPGTFPTAKVIAGYDFVGDAYDASSSNPALHIPHPDPDPLPCGDHGTHVSGTAAGFGVNADGSTFHGPYTAAGVAGLKVSPGAAPNAALMAFKVFGCEGSVDDAIVIAAINRAVVAGATVINMSLGSDFGSANDVEAATVDNASKAGVIVVASAGNAGPGAYLVGAPATANRALTVAAMDAVPSLPGASIVLSPTSTISAENANNSTALPVTASLFVIPNGSGGVSLGCNVSDFAGAAGKIAVVKRGTCARIAKALNGQAAGAVAVIQINNSSGFPPFEGGVPGLTIPFLGVKSSDTVALQGANGVSVTVKSAAPFANPAFAQVANFSSGGPRNGDSAAKPDVVAPGVSIRSAAMGTGTDGENLSGTSMSSPHTAGIAALVRSAHPSWTPAQTKAAIMNTATDSNLIGFNTRLVGAGAVSAPNAISTVALALTSDGTNALSFNYQPSDEAVSLERSFKIQNTSNQSITYNLTTRLNGADRGAVISISPSTVTVGGHSTHEIEVKLRMSTSALSALPDASLMALGAGNVVTERGLIVATPTVVAPGRFALRVPFLIVPRGLSDVSSTSLHQLTNSKVSATWNSNVRNSGIHAGTADVYAWQLSDPKGNAVSDVDLVSAGLQTFDIPATVSSAHDAFMVFGVNFAGQRSTAASKETDVLIDTNNDGIPDYDVIGTDFGALLLGAPNGIWATFVIDLNAGVVVDAWDGDAPMNGSTLELPVLASDIGLTDGASQFSYTVQSFDLVSSNTDGFASWAKWDPFHPAVTTGQFSALAPGGTDTIAYGIDKAQAKTTPVKGFLVISLDNENGTNQAQRLGFGD